MGCCNNERAISIEVKGRKRADSVDDGMEEKELPSPAQNQATKHILHFKPNEDNDTFPLWVTQGHYVKFQVKGKWRLDPLLSWCSSEGFESNSKQRINYGSLLAKIGNSESFVVKHGDVHLAPVSGPLSFWVHRPKQKLNPSGTLTITIYDAEKLTLNKLYQRLGWIESKQNRKRRKDKLTEAEYDLVTHINDLRLNPTPFYQLFISNSSRTIGITKEYLLQKDHTIAQDLVIGSELNGKITELFKADHCLSSPKREVKKNIALIELNNVQTRVEAVIGNHFKSKNAKVLMKLLKDISGLNMVLAFLLDDRLREVLFDPQYTEIGTKILHNFSENNHLVVLVLTYFVSTS